MVTHEVTVTVTPGTADSRQRVTAGAFPAPTVLSAAEMPRVRFSFRHTEHHAAVTQA